MVKLSFMDATIGGAAEMGSVAAVVVEMMEGEPTGMDPYDFLGAFHRLYVDSYYTSAHLVSNSNNASLLC